jgi:hypothetical protein
MRKVRRAAEAGRSRQRSRGIRGRPEGAQLAGRPGVRLPDAGRGPTGRGREAQLLAWQWALASQFGDGRTALRPGHRPPAWPARAMGPTGQTVRTGWRTGPADLAGGLTRLRMGHSSCRLPVRQVMRKMPGRVGADRPILRTPAATCRLRLASRPRPQARRWVRLPVCRRRRGAHAGEFALASCALAVPGEDEGACPQERFGTLGVRAPGSGCDRRALVLRRGGGCARGMREGGGFGAECGDPLAATAGSAMNGCRRRLR